MSDAHAWAGAPAPTQPAPTPPATAEQAVAAAGAVTWCQHMGHDHNTFDTATLEHLQRAMWEAFVVMWDTAVEHDLTVTAEHVDEGGDPLPGMETP